MPTKLDTSDSILWPGDSIGLTKAFLDERQPQEGKIIDVIVPVFNQKVLVEQCLTSLFNASNSISHEVVVIDDCSTEPALRTYLRKLAESGLITLLINSANRGFTKSVNIGMRLHRDRDVVLLNSDTVVYGDWIDRLHRAAYSAAKVATVNPLTNGSHIGCYPYQIADRAVAFEIFDEQLDQLASEANRGRLVQVHTTVGFCMYIKRACLDAIGLFDEIHFPYGYGEESDFCYRAAKVGWQHLVTGDTFIRHWEGVSFGERKSKLVSDMLVVFERLHPDVAAKDKHFRAVDPILPLRMALDLARVKSMLAGRTTVKGLVEGRALYGNHSENIVFIWNPALSTIQLAVSDSDLFPNLCKYILPLDTVRFNSMIRFLGIDRIMFPQSLDVNSLADVMRRKIQIEAGLEVSLCSADVEDMV
jgi:GT2 family glycosyltransferase